MDRVANDVIDEVANARDERRPSTRRGLNRPGRDRLPEMETWADAIEGREDIGFEPGHEETLSQFVFETANPCLAEDLTDRSALSWIERFTSSP